MNGQDLKPRQEKKISRPKQYVVKFINDDFTPMEFVVAIMMEVFKMDLETAEAKTLEVHNKGQAVHGPLTHEIAETRATIAMDWAKTYEFPFRCSVEEG